MLKRRDTALPCPHRNFTKGHCMARIIYGVHGTGHGHAIRALTVARHFGEHEFLFLSHGAGADILRPEFRVLESDCLVTVVRQHKVAGLATVGQNALILANSFATVRRLRQIIAEFKPDVALTDYDFFLPRVARRLGLPCLSLDHQHIISVGRHHLPWRQMAEYVLTKGIIDLLFSAADVFLATSFFCPPEVAGATVRVVPPLLRDQVIACQSRPGSHVVAYQGYETFKRFFPLLQTIPRPVMVYGFDEAGQQGNLTFKKKSETGFLEDLAGCSYLICGGSHTLLSEALYLGKPVLSFPITGAFEQFLNAFYLDRLGYGRKLENQEPSPDIFPAFEARLEQMQKTISQGSFCGNQLIYDLISHFIAHRTLPAPHQTLETGH
jgi:uncharacterized protein (TIGR00661 family)